MSRDDDANQLSLTEGSEIICKEEYRGMEAIQAAKPVIKVAALCGSLRKGSYHRGLLRTAMQISKKSISGMEIEYIDISPLPMLNTDLEVDGKYPPVVEAFRQKILEVDSILFASPEYNYSVTGPLKNAIDWASRAPNVWADKAAAIVSTGGDLGGGRAQYHLRQIGVYLDLHFINKPEFFLHAFQPPAKFDSDGNLIYQPAKEKLEDVLLALQAFTLRLQACKLNRSALSEFPSYSIRISEEGPFSTPFIKENLGQRFLASTEYKLGSSECYNWDDSASHSDGKRVISLLQDRHFKLKDRKNRHKARERMYRMALAASWVFFLVAFLLSYLVKNVDGDCCMRSMFGRSLDPWLAYS